MSSSNDRRYKSTPRPRKAETPRPQNTYGSWDAIAYEQSQPRQRYSTTSSSADRRSKSSMRHQSAQRQQQSSYPSQPIKSHPSEKYQQYMNSKAGNERSSSARQLNTSRSSSTGRARNPLTLPSREDPVDIANQIWKLREKRESQGSSYGRSSTPSSTRGRSSYPMSSTSTRNRSDGGTYGGIDKSKAKKSVLDDLELEERQFFEELDVAPIPTTASRSSTPKTPRPASTAANQSSPIASAQSNRQRDQSGIPMVIRTPSNPRGGRLPAAPPKVSNSVPSSAPRNATLGASKNPGYSSSNGTGTPAYTSTPASASTTPASRHPKSFEIKSSYVPLSPRKISKMDRHELELECQTLVRELQIVEKSRNQAVAELEQQKPAVAESRQNKTLVSRLQEELRQAIEENKLQYSNFQQTKQQMDEAHKSRFRDQSAKLHKTQENVDALKADLTITRQQLGRCQDQAKDAQRKLLEREKDVDGLKTREADLEMQLSEAKRSNTSLAAKLERKKQDIARLEEKARFDRKKMQASANEKDEAYESRITSLEQQLSLSHEKQKKLQDQIDKQSAEIIDKDHDIKLAKAKDAQQAAMILEQKEEMDKLRQENEEALSARKEEQSATTVKMQTMVESHAAEVQTYEERIKSLQEQLRHQTDRHHAELEDRRKQNEEEMERMKESIARRIRNDEAVEAERLRKELYSLQASYEQNQQDLYHRLKETEHKERSACEEYEKKDEMRLREMNELHTMIDACRKDIKQKEKQLKELDLRTQTEAKKNREMIATMEAQHAEDVRERDQTIESQRQQLRTTETKLKAEISEQEAEFAELEKARQEAVGKLQQQLREANERMEESKRLSEETLSTIEEKLTQSKADYKALQSEFAERQQRYEDTDGELRVEIAKLEGKLRASDASLRQKRARIDELEHKLHEAASNSKEEQEKLSEMESLRREIDNTSELLEKEKVQVAEKEHVISRLQDEVLSMKVKVKSMAKLEDRLKDMEQQLFILEEEKTKLSAESGKYRTSYEEATAKLIEMEQQLSIEKDDIVSELKKKERYVGNVESRYKRKVEALERDLDAALKEKRDIENCLEDANRQLSTVTTEKKRKDKELANLRSDYEDLSELLEENLHKANKTQGLEERVEQTNRVLSETKEQYQKQICELESKIASTEQNKATLEAAVERLRQRTKELEAEKAQQSEELTAKRIEFENVSAELMQTKRNHSVSKDGIEAELNRKDKQLRETVQKYSTKIADLETKLEEETQSKLEIEDKLSSARSELEEKQKQTQALIQRNTKNVMKLEGRIEESSMKIEELQAKLNEANEELDNKRSEIKNAIGRYSAELSDLQTVQRDREEVKGELEKASSELQKRDQQASELQSKLTSLMTELETKSSECKSYKSQAEKLELEIKSKDAMLSNITASHDERVAGLEARLNDYANAHKSSSEEVDGVRSQLSQRQSEIDDMQRVIADLNAKLDQAIRARDSAKQKADQVIREMDEKESRVREFEMEKIEFETRLHTQTRAKDELRSKVSELTSKLERKEREIREVADRYKMYIMELESKLDQDSTMKYRLQEALDVAKTDATGASTEVYDLRAKVAELEREIAIHKDSRDTGAEQSGDISELEAKLRENDLERREMEMIIDKAEADKQQVLNALQGVIEEINERDDEIGEMHEKIDKLIAERDHAKGIAESAVHAARQHSEDARAAKKDSDERISKLTEALDRLTGDKQTLEMKLSMMERDLRDRTVECRRVKEQLRHVDGRGLADDASAFSNSSSNFSGSNRRLRDKLRQYELSKPVDSDDLTQSTFTVSRSFSNADSVNPSKSLNFDLESFSPESARSESEFGSFLDGQQSQGSHDSEPERPLEPNDNDAESRSGLDSISGQSKRSTHNDALRKYVQRQYRSKRAGRI